MALKSLNQLRQLRLFVTNARRLWLVYFHGVSIHPTTSISLTSRMLAGRRGSVTVGAESLIAFKALLYSRDPATGADRPVVVGRRCFIGGGATIMPGVTVHDEAIVGAGAVVTEDVLSNTIVAGNPARVLKRDIIVGPFGRLSTADENTRRMWQP